MTLHWGASHISTCLPPDLVERFYEAYADPSLSPNAVTGLPIYNGKTGELVMEMGADRPCRVSRRKMRALCAEGLDVKYGKKVTNARVLDNGKVEVSFEDGERVVGDVLVGCDGAKSCVRSVLCGEEKAKLTNAPVAMFNFPYSFKDVELARKIRGMNELFITSIHPEHGNMFWLSSKFKFTFLSILRRPHRNTVLTTTEILQSKTSPTQPIPQPGPSKSSSPSRHPVSHLPQTSPPKLAACPSSSLAEQATPSHGAPQPPESLLTLISRSTRLHTGRMPRPGTITAER
jgi:hypothetical protein